MVNTFAVIGAGTMGNGIAQVAARAGLNVLMHDLTEDFLNRGLQAIDSSLSRDVKKERLTESGKQEILGRIRPVTELEALAEADFVVEAVVENVEIKTALFARLDQLTRSDVILASNTSSIAITRLGAATKRPEKVIGMHFMNPVPVMPLVEVICGLATDEATKTEVEALCARFGKTAISVNDAPGFVSNRVLMPMINEAIFTLYEGVATAEAIDGIMKLGMNHPMGPLTLADFIGLDVCLAIMDVLYDGFGDPKYRACPLLRQYVAAGWLGRKSGRGFYKY